MPVREADRLIRHAQAQRRAAGRLARSDLLRGQARTGAGIDRLVIAQVRGLRGVQLRTRAKARIHPAHRAQAVQVLLVDVPALALEKRRLVPAKAEPGQVLDAGRGEAARAAGHVDVLDAQQEPPARAARAQVGEHRAQHVAQVQPSAGRGGEAPGDAAHASISGVRGPLLFLAPSGASSSISSFWKRIGSVKCSFV